MSTVLCLILDGLPGVCGPGETHWILDEPEAPWICSECQRQPCPIYTAELAHALRDNPAMWWPTFFDYTGASTIVSSDKLPKNYDVLGLPDVAVYLYRDPREWILSRISRVNSGIIREESIQSAAESWTGWNRILLTWLAKRAVPYTTLSADVFADSPVASLHALCHFLQLPYDVRALDWAKHRRHKIGGNFNLRGTGSRPSMGQNLRRSIRWPRLLSPTMQSIIRTSDGLLDMVRRLEAENRVQPPQEVIL